jgi:hypothetical protein
MTQPSLAVTLGGRVSCTDSDCGSGWRPWRARRWLPVCSLPRRPLRAGGDGGGVVSGPLGATSRLGITASEAGGHLLWVMVGRSSGSPFGPWQAIGQMQRRGIPGTLHIAGEVSSSAGVATFHVVGTTTVGAERVATVIGVSFVSSQRAGGGGGVAWHELDVSLPSGAVTFGPKVMASGHISVSR